MHNTDPLTVPAISPAGDRALVLDFGNVIDVAVNDRVMAYRTAAEKAGIPGVAEIVPTYRSLLILYDPSVITYASLTKKLLSLSGIKGASTSQNCRLLKVPCLYGGEAGPDLAELAAAKGMTEEEVIRLHSAPEYKVYMLGFLPGFVYLGGLDSRIAAPRLATPRTLIPEGSVGIGGSQTGVYPVSSPGGWRLIGKTPLPFYDPESDTPILCRAGDHIRFIPVDRPEYDSILHDVGKGIYSPVFEERTGEDIC